MSEFQPTSTSFRPGSRTLPGDYYTSEAILAEERVKIFMQAWHCVGRSTRVSEPGQYFLGTIAGESIIGLRDRKNARGPPLRSRSTMIDSPAIVPRKYC